MPAAGVKAGHRGGVTLECVRPDPAVEAMFDAAGAPVPCVVYSHHPGYERA